MTETAHRRSRKRHTAEDDTTSPSAHETPNGSAAATSDGSATADATARPVLTRAEDCVDRLGARVSNWAAAAGAAVNTWLGRAREEAEDMWAEAQEIRNRRKA